MLTFCTLFDSNYLDKGIVLYESLKQVITENFKIYILAMDERCEFVLKELNLEHVVVISLSNFYSLFFKWLRILKTILVFCWVINPKIFCWNN